VELAGARPEWPSLVLAPLSAEAMQEVLAGLVPGLPDDLAAMIVDRADGVPLYAVETVRMLLDRGLLAQDDARYVVTGTIDELAIPETLQALLAARLDGLEPAERALVQDAAVLGHVFSAAGLASLGGRTIDEAERVLERLVAKQVVAFEDSELSAERGQYRFLQALLRTIAYGTLTRRDRKVRHMAAARYIRDAWGSDGGEIAEVLATHYLAAADADPEASDAPGIREAARETLAEAGRRAASLALGEEAQRIFDKATELAPDDASRADLLERAGLAAWLAGQAAPARERLDAAIALFEAGGRTNAAAGAMATVADILASTDRLDEALPLTQRAYEGLDPGAERAAVAAQLAKLHMLRTDLDAAIEMTDEALMMAEPKRAWQTIADALITRGTVQVWRGRPEEGNALMTKALELALGHDLQVTAIRAHNNLGATAWGREDAMETLAHCDAALELTRARGDRVWERQLQASRVSSLAALGRWDEAMTVARSLQDIRAAEGEIVYLSDALPALARIHGARGDSEGIEQTLDLLALGIDSADTQIRSSCATAKATAALAVGRPDEALELALPVLETNEPGSRAQAFETACVAAWELGAEDELRRLVARVRESPPGESLPSMSAHAYRFDGLLQATHGDHDGAGECLRKAAEGFRAMGHPFELAQVHLEHGALLRERPSEADPLLDAARSTFADLGALPWMARVEELRAGTASRSLS
jgi:tetratricopeptide (TPR) repeat protein